jgi:hypothetical protein
MLLDLPERRFEQLQNPTFMTDTIILKSSIKSQFNI